MKKIYFLFAIALASFSVNAQSFFAGSDFEDWDAFTGGLNSYGLTDALTVAQGVGEGADGSNSLSIDGTATGNKYVFTALAPSGLPSDITAVTFMIKGTSPSKSLSINIYKSDGTSYARFNGSDLTGDVTLAEEGSNQYSGSIDTAGDWTTVTLDLSTVTDYQTTAGENLIAVKIGKNSEYAIDLDNFLFVSESMGTIDLSGAKVSLVRNTVVKDVVVFGTDAKVEVFNMVGQVVKTAEVTEGSSLNLSNLPKGIYMVKGVSNGKTLVKKIIKK